MFWSAPEHAQPGGAALVSLTTDAVKKSRDMSYLSTASTVSGTIGKSLMVMTEASVMVNDDWEKRIEACWSWIRSSNPSPEQLVETIDLLAAERAPDDPAALYERGSARDSAGRESEAEPLYRAALSSGRLDAKRRPQATIQLASTLRNLGQLDESEELLRSELDQCIRCSTVYALPDETRAFLALTLLGQGNSVDAAVLALIALAPHLSRYSRSVSGNAEEISKDGIASWRSGPSEI